MVERLDTVCGYAVVWDSVSQDFAERGARSPRFERIASNVLTVSPNLICDAHHFAWNAFAFGHDRTVRTVQDSHGLAFEADLPPTRAGYDVLKALQAGLPLGVSIEMDDVKSNIRDGVDVVTSATVRAISIMKPGTAIYSAPCVWFASASPGSMPPHVEQARRLWSSTGNGAAINNADRHYFSAKRSGKHFATRW